MFKIVVMGLMVANVALAKSFSDTECERALVPDVYALNIVRGIEPGKVRYQAPLSSPGVNDSWLELGRRLTAFPDFKFLSDLQKLPVPNHEKKKILEEAKKLRRKVYDKTHSVHLAQKAYVRWVINHLYRFDNELRPLQHDIVAPKITVDDPRYQKAVQHVEEMWSHLAFTSREFSTGSLLPSPFPVVVAGGRFREAYYWDAYFGALGLIASGRTDLAAAQLENFLHMIQTFGKVPNGFRDYYLTRSQPPMISMMTMLIYRRRPDDKWLTQRAYPLLRYDYHNFWMSQRYDPETGLNFYSDDLDEMRPERHSADDEGKLGKTYRCVRAQAESGLDFTDAMMGECVASVSLNAFLYRYELDLAIMAEAAGDRTAADEYRLAAERRRIAISQYLWHENSFRNYSLKEKTHSTVQHADQFAMLFTGAATVDQARTLHDQVLPQLERQGGIAASSVRSGKQWDGNNGWAPLNVMAIQGLADYGYVTDANRLAQKWVDSLTHVYNVTGSFYEKIDVGTTLLPKEDGTKYPNQVGFLWTNASYLWSLKFLGVPLKPL